MAEDTVTITARFPDLAGKSAIVTGASRGIGTGIASFLGGQGMKLVLTARSADKGRAVADALQAEGVTCTWVTADLTTEAGRQAAFDAAIGQYGRIDLLVNNAAHMRSNYFLDSSDADIAGACIGNTDMTFRMSLLVARRMVEQGGGVIIHISSVGGLRGHQGQCAYDASKGAINAMTRSMAADLAAHGIRVNAVAPGATLAHPKAHRHVSEKARFIPLGRLGRNEEIGAAVAFLASDAAQYITGHILVVDGGLSSNLTPPGIRV